MFNVKSGITPIICTTHILEIVNFSIWLENFNIYI